MGARHAARGIRLFTRTPTVMYRHLIALLLAAPAAAQVSTFENRGAPPPPAPERCLPRPPGDLSETFSVDLDGLQGCGAAQAWPWTAAFSPGGESLYVSLFGGTIGSGGCRVVRIDPRNGQVLGSAQVGESPEEIAILTDRAGSVQRVFVTGSSDSTVTVLGANDESLATIRIPYAAGSAFPTAFPFGLALSPHGERLYVGTMDGSGSVHVIDTATLTLVPSAQLDLGLERGLARMRFVDNTLVITSSRTHTLWAGATGEVIFVEPDHPGQVQVVTLASSPDSSAYPAPQDLALDCDGRLYVAGFDMGARVFVLDSATRSVLGSLPTMTSQPLGKFQGLCLSPDGLLAVAEYFTSEISLIDTWSGTHLRTLTQNDMLSFHSQPGEVIFSPSGAQAFVPFATTHELVAFDVL